MFTVDESYVYIRFDPFNTTINHILQEDDVSRGGSGRGRPHKLPGVVAPSKVKRICGAEGCGDSSEPSCRSWSWLSHSILQKKWRDQIKVAERFLELNWDTTFATFCKLHQWVVQWAVVWNICWKHFVSQIVYFSVKLPYTVPPDQNNMFSPPPQPKIPLKMQILSQNAIFVTEKVNFYPNNWKFTFLPNRGTTKN